MGSFSKEDSVKLAKALSSSKKTLDPVMAKSLAQNIPDNTPLDNIASIASAVPISCINNTSPATLVNLISSMDMENMDDMKKTFIATKITSSNNATLIENMMKSTADPAIVNSIPTKKLASINVTDIPATNLPPAFVIKELIN